MEKISNEPYFRCLNKMSRGVTRRNQSLYCPSYHQDRGNTTEDWQTLKDHLHQFKKIGYLGEFLVQEDSFPQDLKGACTSRTLALARGLIEVIHTGKKRVKVTKTPPQVLAINSAYDSELDFPVPKKGRWEDESIGSTREDLEDTAQPYENALVVTLRIRGFDVRRVMIYQGSGAEIMYPNMYEGLWLTSNDLTKYDSPLVAFNGTVVMLAG